MRFTSSQVYFSDPLNIMCSRKCDTPLIDASSSREPVLTNSPAANECESGLTSATMSRPLGSWWWWKVKGIEFLVVENGGFDFSNRLSPTAHDFPDSRRARG